MTIYNQKRQFYVDMGFRLKQIRQTKRVSQVALADALDVVPQTIQKYESGEIGMLPEVIHTCATIFKVSVGYFYGEENTSRQFSRVSLMIASEVMRLPSNDIQKNVLQLIKSINDCAPVSRE